MADIHMIMQQVSEASIAMPLVTAFVYLKRLDHTSKLVLIILLFASVPQFTASFASTEQKNLYYNAYTIVELVLWAVIFSQNIPQRLSRILIFGFVIGFIILSLYTFNTESIFDRFFNELVCLDSLLQVFFIMMYFLNLYKDDQQFELDRIPIFWFAIGLLIYAPVTYFYFAFYGKGINDLRLIHNSMNTLMYLLFTVGMMKNLPHSIKITS